MKESAFQSKVKKEVMEMLPGSIIIKTDSASLQGVPDLIILYGDKWAMLECKKSKTASKQPNQEYYVRRFGEMSYAAFIYPENKETILHELQQALQYKGR